MSNKTPISESRSEITNYLDSFGENQLTTATWYPEVMARFAGIDETSRKLIDHLFDPDSLLQGLIVARAHGAFLGGVSLALASQVTETDR